MEENALFKNMRNSYPNIHCVAASPLISTTLANLMGGNVDYSIHKWAQRPIWNYSFFDFSSKVSQKTAAL